MLKNEVQLKAIPFQAWTGPCGSRTLRLLEFPDNRHMTVARLSILRTDRIYPQEIIKGWSAWE